VERFIQQRAVNGYWADYWAKVDPDLGRRVARVGLEATAVAAWTPSRR